MHRFNQNLLIVLLIVAFPAAFVLGKKGSGQNVNRLDTIAKVQELLRQARTDSGNLDINSLLSQNVDDPVPIEPFNVSSSNFITELDGRFTDLELYGLKSFQLDRLAINLSSMNLSAELSVPMLSILGHYFLQGTVTFFPISGEGPFYMNLSSIALRGHSILKTTPEGKLTMGKIHMDSDVDNIALHFDNLMGGGTWGSISNSFLNQLSELILGELEPTLMKELSSYLKYQFDEVVFEQLPAGFVNPASTNLMDSVLDMASDFMVQNGIEPMALPDYKEVYEQRLLFMTTRGELNVYNGSLHGLSTLGRKGDVITVFANNSLIFEADFVFENLTGNYKWNAGVFGTGTEGQMAIEVKSTEGFVKIRQELNSRSKLEVEDFHIKDIRHVWLDLQGLGTWDYVLESALNLVSNGLKLQLADAITQPVRNSIQQQLNLLKIGIPE